MKKADYIILGAGASGLMLAYRMANDSFFDNTTILIIDKTQDKGNDRTWSYWENGNGEWDDLLYKKWTKIYFGSTWFSKEIPINPYIYKTLRSAAFYKELWTCINSKPNFTFIQADVETIGETESGVKVEASGHTYSAQKLFNSIVANHSYKIQSKYPVLKQHFIGWFIKTETDVFDDSVATFMDFNLEQKSNTRFMYVLPTSKTEALFEYTLFSKDLLETSEYENAIRDYLRERKIENYRIVEKEKGSIPMTSYRFSKQNSKHVLNIGTAGGWTKASTGYTFMNTTKKTRAVVAFLKKETNFLKFDKRTKFWYYDLLLLDVLASDNGIGAKLFSSLFEKTKVKTIFKFLDEESSYFEDLRIITAVPPLKFIKALVKRLF